MKKLSTVAVFVITLLIPIISLACKDVRLGKAYPITDFKQYDSIVIVKIDESTFIDSHRYRPLVSFKATVLENIKGKLNKGISFSGKPKQEQPRAVCPVQLIESDTYLLLLSEESGAYFISRFSFPVESNNKYFSNYISQIKSAINSE
jgi:hypothetical protein